MKWGQSHCSSEFLKCYVAFRTLGCGGRKSSGKFSSQRMRRVWKEGKKKEKKPSEKQEGSSRAIKGRIQRCCNIICPSSSLSSPPTVLGNTLGIAGATPARGSRQDNEMFLSQRRADPRGKKKKKKKGAELKSLRWTKIMRLFQRSGKNLQERCC